MTAILRDLGYTVRAAGTAAVIAHRGVLQPGVDFIRKPFSMEDLAAKVRTTRQKV